MVANFPMFPNPISPTGLPSSRKTRKGIEKTFAVNYLSHFYLTISLIDLIKKTKNSRLVNISSMVHKFAKLNLNDMNFSKNYNGYVAYFNSKLMNLLFSY